jgi:hypothetical protein
MLFVFILFDRNAKTRAHGKVIDFGLDQLL